MIATDLPRINTEVKHQVEKETQTPGDIVWSFLIRLLFCTHKFALNLKNLHA